MLSTKINQVVSAVRQASILTAIGTAGIGIAAAAPASALPSAAKGKSCWIYVKQPDYLEAS
jgi:hypothetical protein